MLKPYFEKSKIEAGCDEAGRGCLAGPVFAAAVILKKDFHHPLLNDSKQMKAADRDMLRVVIESEAAAWAVAMCSEKEIDELNILNASILAMHRALNKLKLMPELILVDGNRFKPYNEIEFRCIIKGDAQFACIAAASVLAKTHRDEYMKKLHNEFPYYGWNTNKAYATSLHREALMQYGESPYHRKSFRLNYQYELDLK